MFIFKKKNRCFGVLEKISPQAVSSRAGLNPGLSLIFV